jgi:thiosulfate/3-mercaptopyruvate sulfurtransferase
MSSLLISPDELALILNNERVHVLDIRWRLGSSTGKVEYIEGHIPGAVYVDLDAELADHAATGEGRHPLPGVENLQTSARRWGLNDGDTVVVYDDLKNLSSTRAWWLLRYAGFDDVRVLDGSLRGWIANGGALDTDDVEPPLGTVTLQYGHLETLSVDDAADLPFAGVLLDARAEERYRGEVEPIDPRAGHIPGAISAPTTANVDAVGRFLEPEALRARFEALGVTDDRPVGAYCGSGVTASHETFALTLAGFSSALYPGSWSQWSTISERPVATGPDPEGALS